VKKIKHKKPQPNTLVKLSFLYKGQKGIVKSLENIDRVLRRRLLDMGITEGVLIHVKKVAPLGDPVDIELRGYELCLRRRDMDAVFVEVIK
jgi:ferrous iron transport protein A